MNNSTRTRKPKVKVTTYENRYESLEQMVNDLITIHPEIDKIFNLEDAERITPRFLHDEALEYFTLNEPNVVEGINLPVAISITANGVSLKTAKFFTLKWNFKYDRNSGFVTDVVASISVFVKDPNKIGKALANMINILEDEWKVVENSR